jgi:hypothetical protein
LIIPDNFPDPRIAQSFLSPQIKQIYSPKKFLKQIPSKKAVVSYCKSNLGWSDTEGRNSLSVFVLAFLFILSLLQITAQIIPVLQKLKFDP